MASCDCSINIEYYKTIAFLLKYETWKVSEFTLLYEITQISSMSMTRYVGNEQANYNGKHVKWSYFKGLKGRHIY